MVKLKLLERSIEMNIVGRKFKNKNKTEKSKFDLKWRKMDAVKKMRNEVKKYIDTADEKVVKMMHAMLEVDAEADWWDAMPEEVKRDLELSMKQADNKDFLTHEEVKKKYAKWFTR